MLHDPFRMGFLFVPSISVRNSCNKRVSWILFHRIRENTKTVDLQYAVHCYLRGCFLGICRVFGAMNPMNSASEIETESPSLSLPLPAGLKADFLIFPFARTSSPFRMDRRAVSLGRTFFGETEPLKARQNWTKGHIALEIVLFALRVIEVRSLIDLARYN